MKAKISGAEKEYRTSFYFPKEATLNPEVERLWAYAQIQEFKDKADYLGVNNSEYRSPIIDTAVEYGLVTDFTSMLVMTDEQFEQNGIERRNRDRRTKEQQAAAQRQAQPVQSKRVDQNKPAFSSNRVSYSGGGGGGSMGPFGLLMMLPLAIAFIRRRKQ